MRSNWHILLVLQGILISAAAHAQDVHHHDQGNAACDRPELACATTATPVFGPDGTLWLTWAAGGTVSVAQSRDLGQTWSKAVAVSPAELPLDSGADARPKIVIDPSGAVIVTFATRDDKYNGSIFAARSEDGGQTFSTPEAMAKDSPSQRFEAVAVKPDGSLFTAWIDKRNAAAKKSKGEEYAGAALVVATAAPHSLTFTPATIIKDNSCECCRIGLALTRDGNPAIVFRNIFEGGVRDHGVITFTADGTAGAIGRVSNDDWATDACPHHGPSLAIAGDGSYVVSWFTAGRKRKGVFYARSTDGGLTFSEPVALGRPEHQVSRPYVLAVGDSGVRMAWKEFDGERTEVLAMQSNDNGAHWSSPQVIAETRGASDHPILVTDGKATYLSWMSKAEGYRLIAIGSRE